MAVGDEVLAACGARNGVFRVLRAESSRDLHFLLLLRCRNPGPGCRASASLSSMLRHLFRRTLHSHQARSTPLTPPQRRWLRHFIRNSPCEKSVVRPLGARFLVQLRRFGSLLSRHPEIVSTATSGHRSQLYRCTSCAELKVSRTASKIYRLSWLHMQGEQRSCWSQASHLGIRIFDGPSSLQCVGSRSMSPSQVGVISLGLKFSTATDK